MRKTETIRQLNEAREHCKRQAGRARSFSERKPMGDMKQNPNDKKKREARWKRRQEYYRARAVTIADGLDCILREMERQKQ